MLRFGNDIDMIDQNDLIDNGYQLMEEDTEAEFEPSQDEVEQYARQVLEMNINED